MGVNSLPKTVTRQRRGCDLFEPGPYCACVQRAIHSATSTVTYIKSVHDTGSVVVTAGVLQVTCTTRRSASVTSAVAGAPMTVLEAEEAAEAGATRSRAGVLSTKPLYQYERGLTWAASSLQSRTEVVGER